MPRISGKFSLVPSYKAVPGEIIRTENHNPPLEDIAQALTDSLPRDGTAAMTASLPMGGNRITNLAAATLDTDAVRRGQVQTIWANAGNVDGLNTSPNQSTYDVALGSTNGPGPDRGIIVTQRGPSGAWVQTFASTEGGARGFWFREYTGSVWTSWEPMRSRDLTPQDFGAVGDGIADDSNAMEQAFLSGKSVYIPPGVYKITRTCRAKHPLRLRGAGKGVTTLRYHNMGGYAGQNGIVLEVAGTSLQTATKVEGFTVNITGQNGGVWFKTPRDTFGTDNPQYIFNELFFNGDPAASPGPYFELCATAWECCIELADGNQHAMTNITGNGNYDFRAEPTATAITSKLFRWSCNEASGGLRAPYMSNVWAQHFGMFLAVGWRVARPQIHNVGIHLCWEGIYSPNPRTGSNWGMEELEMGAVNLNVQKRGYLFVGGGGMILKGVDVTRASGGFNHGTTWIGGEARNVTRFELSGGRGYSAAATGEYTGFHYGLVLTDNTTNIIRGMMVRGTGAETISAGIRIINPVRGSISEIAIAGAGSVTNLISFVGTPATPDTSVGYTLSGVPKASGVVMGDRIAYADACSRTIVNDLDEVFQVDPNVVNISAGGTETIRMGTSRRFIRRAFLAGTGPYTYDIIMGQLGSREGDEVEFHLRLDGPNSTVRILDTVGDVQATFNTEFESRRYAVRGRYLGTATKVFRVASANVTIF